MQNKPLAERLRPKTLANYVGQSHIIGVNGTLSKSLEQKMLPSLILWGPPGTGKTTLAQIIATLLDRPFFALSAINSGVSAVREVLDKAQKSGGIFTANNPVLFIDEIHRFSKSQQDSLLNAVEKGIITLIGATTENPSFEVIPALLSRCQVYVLKSLEKEELELLLQKAVNDDEILKQKNLVLKETTALLRISGGDARKLLNSLELVAMSVDDATEITDALVMQIVPDKLALFDKNGEQHYDIVSAFIKSIRGSDPNAAVYWLARMIEGGEDPKFIARRLLILASEDIGLANPTALILANNAFQAVQVIGFPESRIILSECVIYLATSPKSNSAYMAINQAQALVKDTGDLPVPLHLRNTPTKLMKELGYGDNYKYAHNYEGHFVNQEFFPEQLSGTKLYEPADNTREKPIKEFIEKRWEGKY